MKGYFLVREKVPYAVAMLAATKDLPEFTTQWLGGSVRFEPCRINGEEFERARTYTGAVVLLANVAGWNEKEVAIAFRPRDLWPEEFSQFRNLFDADHELEEEREYITEMVWLTCDTRPHDLANFALPQVSVWKLRAFAVGCCRLVSDKILDVRSRRAVEVATRHSQKAASDEELASANEEAQSAADERSAEVGLCGSPEVDAAYLAGNTSDAFDPTFFEDLSDGWFDLGVPGSISDFIINNTIGAARGDPLIRAKITGLLRDTCGNPFRPSP